MAWCRSTSIQRKLKTFPEESAESGRRRNRPSGNSKNARVVSPEAYHAWSASRPSVSKLANTLRLEGHTDFGSAQHGRISQQLGSIGGPQRRGDGAAYQPLRRIARAVSIAGYADTAPLRLMTTKRAARKIDGSMR